MKAILVGTAAAAAFLLPAGAAGAAGSGVHVDPGSPTSKEYQLPVAAARTEASGGGNGGTNAPTFGAGITPSGQGKPAASSGTQTAHVASAAPATPVPTATASVHAHRTHASSHARRTRKPHRANATRRPTAAVALATAAQRSPQPTVASTNQPGNNGWLAVAAGGGLVLLLGAGGGLAVRRRLRV